MMKGNVLLIVFFFIVWVFSGCLDPYKPHELTQNVRYLVVDGFLNTTDSSCTINLSRTIPMDTTTQIPVERGAKIKIVDDNGEINNLTETSPGVYTGTKMILDIHKKYQIAIQTSDQKSYLSDFSPVTISPPIDSVNWAYTSAAGIEIYVNTHDPNVQTGYYRWKFTETWAYHSIWRSHLKVDSTGKVVERKENITDCWMNNVTSDIRISTTSKLNQNIISDFPLVSFALTDTRLENKYSILVEQRALSAEFYSYAQQLKNTTESLGSLFDPLPSTVTGNIHCLSDPTEIVLGYFSAGAVTRKRVFISKHDVDPSYSIVSHTGYEDCKEYLVPLDKLYELAYWPPFDYHFIGDSQIVDGYWSAPIECEDCRLMGGTNVQPPFWQ